MIQGSFSMAEKRERVFKYFVADEAGNNPVVVNAKDEDEAAIQWAKRTGLDKSGAAVRRIGARATTITRRDQETPVKETKPAKASPDRETKEK